MINAAQREELERFITDEQIDTQRIEDRGNHLIEDREEVNKLLTEHVEMIVDQNMAGITAAVSATLGLIATFTVLSGGPVKTIIFMVCLAELLLVVGLCMLIRASLGRLAAAFKLAPLRDMEVEFEKLDRTFVNMQILAGFFEILSIVTFTLACIALNPIAVGLSASIGVTSCISAVGLFAAGRVGRKERQEGLEPPVAPAQNNI